MIVATAMLIFLLLVFMPIHFEVRGRYIFTELSVQTQIKVFCLTLAKERVFVDAQGVGYQGTVDGYLQNDKDSQQDGVDIAKSITMHSVQLYFRNDLSKLNVNAMIFQNAILSVITQIVCCVSNCQFACLCNNFSNIDDLQFRVKGSVSVAELSFCFIKQGVRKCKHKLLK